MQRNNGTNQAVATQLQEVSPSPVKQTDDALALAEADLELLLKHAPDEIPFGYRMPKRLAEGEIMLIEVQGDCDRLDRYLGDDEWISQMTQESYDQWKIKTQTRLHLCKAFGRWLKLYIEYQHRILDAKELLPSDQPLAEYLAHDPEALNAARLMQMIDILLLGGSLNVNHSERLCRMKQELVRKAGKSYDLIMRSIKP